MNIGFIWESPGNLRDAHVKYYLPEEPGFWEATWYCPGVKEFKYFQTQKGRIGFLICTEVWFNTHAWDYGKQDVQLLACPRATEHATVQKWVIGGRAAAVVSGAYCLSSNRSWDSAGRSDTSAGGWIIEPENGEVLGLTSSKQPFLTLEIDLSLADHAKRTYPRYVRD